MNILRLINESEYIQINNHLMKPDLLFASEDFADDDDVAVEAEVNGMPFVLTVADLEEALPLADGGFWLETVGYVRFVSRASLH